MKYRYLCIFKLSGSYIGLFIGFIASLQIKNNRMFLLEGRTDIDCEWNLIKELSCSNLALLSIILFLVIGFVVGGLVHEKNNKK
jgi:hypothetical protein